MILAAALVPGFASEAIGDLLWERRHGRAKRIATVAFLVQREGWSAQCAHAEQTDGGEAQHLTVDAAMLLVDRALQGAGSSQACTREEVESAFAHLADSLIASAVWFDPQRTAIVILSPPAS
ncbi:MAG: hypothetical protein ACLPYS_03370 [Vulcanimicrobiaceae bacterium]